MVNDGSSTVRFGRSPCRNVMPAPGVALLDAPAAGGVADGGPGPQVGTEQVIAGALCVCRRRGNRCGVESTDEASADPGLGYAEVRRVEAPRPHRVAEFPQGRGDDPPDGQHLGHLFARDPTGSQIPGPAQRFPDELTARVLQAGAFPRLRPRLAWRTGPQSVDLPHERRGRVGGDVGTDARVPGRDRSPAGSHVPLDADELAGVAGQAGAFVDAPRSREKVQNHVTRLSASASAARPVRTRTRSGATIAA
jgi:hypothetical protein